MESLPGTFFQSQFKHRISLTVLLLFLAVGSDSYYLYNPSRNQALKYVTATAAILCLVLLGSSFRRRLFLVYLPTCVLLGLLWLNKDPSEWIVMFATVLSIWLAAGAIDLALLHEAELRSVIQAAKAHTEQVEKVESLIRSTFGLENYIAQASSIYKEPSIERVVTSLRHWVARGDPARYIEDGITESTAKELVFVGTIDWNVYFPGVLWRFVMLRKILRAKGNGCHQIARIYHVEEGVPLFVVSKRESGKTTPGRDHGSLLIGNPMQSAGTQLYGIDLGRDHPQQVDHYNFVFDTLICPKERMIAQWETIKQATGIERPYFHEDGITTIFETNPFKEGCFIYSEEVVCGVGDTKNRLIEQKAEQIGREILSIIERYDKRYVFDEWAADQDPSFRRIFYENILPDLKAAGKTLIVISHDDTFFHLGDRILKLTYGQITGIEQPNCFKDQQVTKIA